MYEDIKDLKSAFDDDDVEKQKIVKKLRRAGELYRFTRGRTGVYELLEAAYSIHWVFKQRPRLGREKLLLRKAAGLPASRSRQISDLVLTIAAEGCDRRERHRWKRLLEASCVNRIHPGDLKKRLRELHGVNNAIARWALPVPHGVVHPYDLLTAPKFGPGTPNEEEPNADGE